MNLLTKKRSKVNFKDLLSNSESSQLSIDQMTNIKGGDPTPAQVQALLTSLHAIFTPGVLLSDAHGQDIWNDFNTQLAALAGTNSGYTMLSGIVSAANGRQVNVTGINQGFPEFDDHPITGSTGGRLFLGAMEFNPNRNPANFDYTKQDATHFGTIAHELYHVYAYFTMSTPEYTSYKSTVRKELDAYLFEYMANAEYDQMNNILDWNKSYTKWDSSLYAGGRNSSENTFAMSTAWYHIFHDKTFTVDDYNTLIDNFKSTPQGGGNLYAGLTTGHIDSTTFSSSKIEDLFSTAYMQSTYHDCIPTALQANPPRHPYGAIDQFGFSWDIWYAIEDYVPPGNPNSGGSSGGGTYYGGSGTPDNEFDFGFSLWWNMVATGGYYSGYGYDDWYQSAQSGYDGNGTYWRDIHYNGYESGGGSGSGSGSL